MSTSRRRRKPNYDSSNRTRAFRPMTKELQEVGEVMHLAKSSRLIVRLLGSSSKETRPGEILVDQNGRGVGKVVEIIGPVASPYASVMPLTGRPNKVLGIKVFRGRSLPTKRKR